MIRVYRPLGFLAPSASRPQVARQAAMETIPLIMEPQSRVYTSPVIVLDFQSLYPSIVIAYNMCYSTCLGRLAATLGLQVLGSRRRNDVDYEHVGIADQYDAAGQFDLARKNLGALLDTLHRDRQTLRNRQCLGLDLFQRLLRHAGVVLQRHGLDVRAAGEVAHRAEEHHGSADVGAAGLQRRELRFRFTSNTVDGDYQMGQVIAHIESGDGRYQS